MSYDDDEPVIGLLVENQGDNKNNSKRKPGNNPRWNLGPTTALGFFGTIKINLGFAVLLLLLLPSTFIAVAEGLDSLYVGFRIPLINLIFHGVLFLFFSAYSTWRGVFFFRERLLDDRGTNFLVGILFTILHCIGMIGFIIWAIDYNGVASRVNFSSETIGFISLGIISGVLFVGYGIVMTAWLVLWMVRYSSGKSHQLTGIGVGKRTLVKKLVAEARKEDAKSSVNNV